MRLLYFFIVSLSSCKLLVKYAQQIEACQTHVVDKPDVTKHDCATNYKNDGAPLPVRRISSTVEDDAPESPQNHGSNVHRVESDTAHRIVTCALQDDISPAEDKRIDHVCSAGKIKGEHGSSGRQISH